MHLNWGSDGICRSRTADVDELDKKDGRCGTDLLRLIDLVVFDPELRQKRANDFRAKQEEELARAQELL